MSGLKKQSARKRNAATAIIPPVQPLQVLPPPRSKPVHKVSARTPAHVPPPSIRRSDTGAVPSPAISNRNEVDPATWNNSSVDLFSGLSVDAVAPLPLRRHPKGCSILTGDSLTLLKELEPSTINTCITSPPYWGLRDYGIQGQIGAEPRVDDYISSLVEVFREVRRVLRDDGTLWLNIGDSYTSGGRTWRQTDKKNAAREMNYRAPTPDGLKPKDLIGVPWRLAFALQADGWYLRSEMIWHKPNGLPESVKDRPSRNHEYVFLLSKNERYFYNYEDTREPAVNGSVKAMRSVWSINTEPLREAHFAAFPRQLVARCISAGCPADGLVLDPFLGAGTVGLVAQQLSRRFVGIELNAEYVEIAKKRLNW